LKTINSKHVGNKLGMQFAKMIDDFKYFKPNKDMLSNSIKRGEHHWVPVKRLPQASNTSYFKERMKYDMEVWVIHNFLMMVYGMISAPTPADRKAVMEYVYQVYFSEMEDLLMAQQWLEGNGGKDVRMFRNFKEMAEDYTDFEIQMELVAGHVEKAIKRNKVDYSVRV